MNTLEEIKRGHFKLLRAVDNPCDSSKPLEFAQHGDLQKIHFPKAKGGLRVVDSAEIRQLARESADRLIHVFK
jgi:hypothetical protein